MMRYTLERNAVIVHENAVEGTTTVRWSGGLVDIPAGATGRFEPVTASAMPKPSDASLVDQWMQDLPRFSVSADRRGTMLQTDFGEFVYREHVEALLSQIASARAQEPEPTSSLTPLGYCAICYHPLDVCSHCDAKPLGAQEPGQAQAKPAPDSKEWWNEVAQGLGIKAFDAKRERDALRLERDLYRGTLVGLLSLLDGDPEILRRRINQALYPASSASQEPSPGWQPIETAPKDGTSILVGGGGCPDVHENAFRVYGKGPAMLAGLGNKQQPTHWMPLPSPPVPPTPERSRDHEF